MSPSLAPVSIRAAITSAYRVMAACTPWIEVLRSAVICEIETFITLVSSVMTNWPEARMMIGIHLRIALPSGPALGGRRVLGRELGEQAPFLLVLGEEEEDHDRADQYGDDSGQIGPLVAVEE